MVYYKVATNHRKTGWSLETQKKIIHHFATNHKVEIIKTYLNETNSTKLLEEAISFCCKQQSTLIVTTYDTISSDFDEFMKIRKRLNNRLISCDMPFSSKISLEIAYQTLLRAKKFQSLAIKS